MGDVSLGFWFYALIGGMVFYAAGTVSDAIKASGQKTVDALRDLERQLELLGYKLDEIEGNTRPPYEPDPDFKMWSAFDGQDDKNED